MPKQTSNKTSNRRNKQLWLALYFPQLPIDRQACADADEAQAVVLHEGSRRRILACNRCAAANGVRPGQALKNAYALVPELITSDYNDSEQRQQLEQLTLWALQYSSRVTPEPPDTILLEVAASLTLFGGLDALLAQIHDEARTMQLYLLSGVAPTPSAATLFTRAGVQQPVQNSQTLKRVLSTIPVAALPLDPFTHKGLRQSGIRSLGELLKLPPAALNRRFGQACSDLLYKLDGRLPEPKAAYQAAETFAQALDLPLEAPDTSALAFPLKRLLGSLGGFLRTRDLGICQLDIVLYHHRQTATRVALKFLDPTANTQHLLRVATERLGGIVLSAPVIRLALESAELASLQRQGRDLFQMSQAQSSSIEQLLDKLTARLGMEALYTAMPGDDHRPEKAWMSALLGCQPQERQSPGRQPLECQPAAGQWPARPVWLLPEAKPLTGEVHIQTLPERIENGWWDETDVRRDYFIASTPAGAYYWVYRLRHEPEQWWVHGLFA